MSKKVQKKGPAKKPKKHPKGPERPLDPHRF